MTQVVLDTDFLSSFLKIDRLPLIKDFYRSKALLIPPAVYREVSMTRFAAAMTTLPWVQVRAPEVDMVREISQGIGIDALGAGEREAMALARQLEDAVLLMNDNRARSLATRIGLEPVSIPTFLLACKAIGFVGKEDLAELIADLQEKDRYAFRREMLARLLS